MNLQLVVHTQPAKRTPPRGVVENEYRVVCVLFVVNDHLLLEVDAKDVLSMIGCIR